MDDLQVLAAALTQDEPSQDVIDRSRHRLQNRMHRGPVRRTGARTRWLATGIAGVAAATAVAVIVASGATAPTATTKPTTVHAASAQQVLLAAASIVEKQPDESGSYWHYTMTVTQNDGTPSVIEELWIGLDGRTWARNKNGSKVEEWPRDPRQSNPFSLAVADVTLDQLRSLPTDPDALKAWIREAADHSTRSSSAGPFTARDKDEFSFFSLVQLVSGLPAPGPVRAAAFRAIAEYPNVTSLGEVPGGQGLLLRLFEGDEYRLVVDLATGLVNETNFLVTLDGALYIIPEPGSARIGTDWTDTLPS